MAAQQPTYDQEQAIRDYARLMEAGPLAENEEGLHALIEQAYAYGMYFDYDRDKRSYVLRHGEARGVTAMAEHQWTLDELQALAALGLSITPHSDPHLGWGYTWHRRDWTGPFTTPGHAVQAAFTDALQALSFRSAAPFTQQSGELWRWDGQEDGWFHVGGVGTEDDEEAAVLASAHAFYEALDTLRGIETSEIYIPGPHEKWEQALRVAYRASSDIEDRLTSWQDELESHHEREGRAEDSL